MSDYPREIKYEDDPEILEEKASRWRREGINSENIGNALERAGDLRLKKRQYIRAEDNYVKAKRFGFPYDEDKQKMIDEKILNLRAYEGRENSLQKLKEGRKKKKSIEEKTKLDERNRAFLERLRENQFWGSRVNAIISIALLSISLFFVSAGITGFAVLGLAENNLRNIGICFFACGLMIAFFYLRCKDKKKKKK